MENFLIVINEQHSLSSSQRRRIESAFGKIHENSIVNVPASGWTLQAIQTWIEKYSNIIVIGLPHMLRAYMEAAVKYRYDYRKIWLLNNNGWELI